MVADSKYKESKRGLSADLEVRQSMYGYLV